MDRFTFKKKLTPLRSIYRWFMVCFAIFSIVFFIVLLPIIFYCRSTFAELELQKTAQKANYGISQLDNTITSIRNVSQNLSNDSRFYTLRYPDSTYSEISTSEQVQLRNYLNALMLPVELVTDCALQLSEDDAVTPRVITFGSHLGYYPFQFSVDDLTYEEWNLLLMENSPGFMSMHQVSTPVSSYDALIYSIHWSNNKFFYVCLDVDKVKQVLIEKENLNDYRVTIENSKGSCLYTDAPDSLADFHSITHNAHDSGLVITIHIPKSVLNEHLGALYSFLGLYLTICFFLLAVVIVIGTNLSSRPLARIITTLEGQTRHFAAIPAQECADAPKTLAYGFQYIQRKILAYEVSMQDFQTTINAQSSILRTRFIEKALHGLLTTDSDYHSFYTYFPEFPDKYCLVLIGLTEQPTEKGTIYSNPLSNIHYYLQQTLPHAYLQQLSAQTLLLIIDSDDYAEYSSRINHLLANINQEEPCYHAWGITSNFFQHPKQLALAYLQIQDLRSVIATESLSSLCTASDMPSARKSGFQMSDAANIYTAITNGNSILALAQLQNYSEHLSNQNRSVFEMYRAILLCIKQDFPSLLINAEIPIAYTQTDMYIVIAETVQTFCQLFQEQKEERSDSLAMCVKQYIDLHFTEEGLCSVSLEEHFQCSFDKLRKSFSKEIGTPITSYIMQRRLTLANEMLLRGETSISDVAKQCGFANYNTFHKAYRRTYGCAPSVAKPD